MKDPITYRWSSYRSYAGEEKETLVERDVLLAQCSGTKKGAPKQYEHVVKARIGQGNREDFYALKDQRLSGHVTFVEHVYRRCNEEHSFFYTISIGDIVPEVSSALNIPTDLCCSPSWSRHRTLGRSIAVYGGRKGGGHHIKGGAEHFHRDPVVMSQGIK